MEKCSFCKLITCAANQSTVHVQCLVVDTKCIHTATIDRWQRKLHLHITIGTNVQNDNFKYNFDLSEVWPIKCAHQPEQTHWCYTNWKRVQHLVFYPVCVSFQFASSHLLVHLVSFIRTQTGCTCSNGPHRRYVNSFISLSWMRASLSIRH